MENGRAVGVRVGRKSGDVTVRAPMVISGAGLYNTFERLLPRHVASKSYYTDICSTLKVGVSIQANYTLDGQIRSVTSSGGVPWLFG